VIAPYEDLLAGAERELELAAAGRWEELAAAAAERVRAATSLGPAPAAAEPILRRLAFLQDELGAIVLAARADTARELTGLHRGRGAVQGYAAPAALGGSALLDDRG
jgi:hypothetical protein